ncbi:MAG: hypothetical protein HOO93_12610 [Methyloglobulus sp.]|nr:hypothetical protein [Methyloglobulus sp.]
MLIEKELKKIESDYYEIFCKISFNPDAEKWMGKVRIVRKDTGEVVRGGFRVFDENKKNLQKQLVLRCIETLPNELILLGKPYEWQSEGRKILIRYLALMDSIANFGKFYRESVANNHIADENERTVNFVKFWNLLLDESTALTRSIELLTEEDRCSMLKLPEHVFDNLSDPWNLDEIDSKLGIYRFFLNPSQLEAKIHNSQKRALKKQYKSLGWS